VASALDLVNLVFRHPEPPDLGTRYFHAFCEGNRRNMRIIKAGGRVVAHAGIFYLNVRTPRGTLRVGSVGAVACHPDYRRRGFATAVVQDCAAKMRKDGAHLGLLGTGIPDWYRRMGWELAGSSCSFAVDAGNADLLPEPSLPVVEGPGGREEAILHLYQNHSYGAERSLELFSALLRTPGTHLYSACSGKRPVAYCLLRGETVFEHGGEPEAAAALLRQVFHTRMQEAGATSEETTRLKVLAPAHGTGLAQVLEELGFPRATDYLAMLNVIDAAALLGAVNLNSIAAETTGTQTRLSTGTQTVELGPRMLAKLLFGPERPSPFGAEFLPLPFYCWPLDRI
jgi:GNAT superfamily N-acetyltransferase